MGGIAAWKRSHGGGIISFSSSVLKPPSPTKPDPHSKANMDRLALVVKVQMAKVARDALRVREEAAEAERKTAKEAAR